MVEPSTAFGLPPPSLSPGPPGVPPLARGWVRRYGGTPSSGTPGGSIPGVPLRRYGGTSWCTARGGTPGGWGVRCCVLPFQRLGGLVMPFLRGSEEGVSGRRTGTTPAGRTGCPWQLHSTCYHCPHTAPAVTATTRHLHRRARTAPAITATTQCWQRWGSRLGGTFSSQGHHSPPGTFSSQAPTVVPQLEPPDPKTKTLHPKP